VVLQHLDDVHAPRVFAWASDQRYPIIENVCKNGIVVTETKFVTVDGYSIVDLGGAVRTVGPARSAKKVLQRTTIDLVRHATYALAIHGHNACGAAVALNHDRSADDQSPIAAFASELQRWSVDAKFTAHIGLGLGANEIGPTLHPSAAIASELIAASAVASIPDDSSVIIIASDGDEPALQAELAGAFPKAAVAVEADLAAALASGAEVVFVRTKLGELHHDALAETNVRRIVGLQPLTTTARGLAVASRHGTTIVPDFISAAGPYLAALDDDVTPETIAAATRSVIAGLGASGTTMFIDACEVAETHIRTWASEPPFGRPLAP
jgi:hypothetical protein